jgi:cellulose synthase/poly-beta-1,6-N-acetylglucosamine synthase-like glycosyltransferase
MAALVFWLFVGLLGYIYVGYPVVARLAARVAGKALRTDATTRPSVTLVITAYNEAKGIREKIENVLALDYPSNLLDVIVASDASNDDTDAIVKNGGWDHVKLLRVEGRKGKTACQNAAVACATGEIVVFTDATTRIDKHALLAMVANFADGQVGCVAGLLVYEGRGRNLTASGGVSYWGYEIALRQAESRLGTLVGVSGCLYAVRRCAYQPIPPNLISDFVIAMRMREQKLRTVLETQAICFEETLDRGKQELAMRVRVAVRSIAALVSERRYLNVLRDPLFAWQLWSHKLLRYLSPYWLICTLVSSAVLVHEPLYRTMFVVQLAVLLAGLAGFALQARARELGILSKPYYFLLTNIASMIATLRYFSGARMVTWTPIR